MKTEYNNFGQGILWKDNNEVYHWSSMKTGKVYNGYNPEDPDDEYDIIETVIKFMPMLREFKCSWTDEYSNNLVIINVEDTVLIGSKSAGSWQEASMFCNDAGYVVYTGKGNTGLAIIITPDGQAYDLIRILFDVARFGTSTLAYDEELKNFGWVEGLANWQGAPISESQELKLKFLGYWNKEPYINYRAARLEDLDISVYITYNSDEDMWYTGRCNSKHKFYTVDKEET